MLVMDEFFDNWGHSKVPFDNTLNFQHSWRGDVASIIDMAYNHPSVLMYSIGNEIADTGSPNGSVQGRLIVEEIRRLDPNRLIINAINGMVSIMGIIEQLAAQSASQHENASAASQAEGQEAINSMMSDLGSTMSAIMTLPAVGRQTEESFSVIDIAGYNYMDSRYAGDAVEYPNRIMCGTETFVPAIYKNWKLVRSLSHVIGDFCWTGWDYMGEPSTGLVKYEAPPLAYGMGLPFPALNSQVGEFTITGNKRTCSYYHEIVIGNRREPFIAVYRPEHFYNREILTPWSWGDTVTSYSYEGFEGKPIKVQVYTDAEEIELFQNGSSLGRQAVPEEAQMIAVYTFTYEPGTLKAVNYRGGMACESYTVASASGSKRLVAEAENPVVSFANNDVVFVNIRVTDAQGITFIQDRSQVTLQLEGPAVLAGFATDDPCPAENICDATRTLYDGTALAILRPCGTGTVRIMASAPGFDPKTIEITIV
jgi:beta-galactosidase